MQLVKKLDYKVSYGKLFHLIEDIRKSNPLISKMNGLSLQHRKGVPNPWNIVDGLESLRLYNGASEKDFCQIHEKFINTGSLHYADTNFKSEKLFLRLEKHFLRSEELSIKLKRI